MPLSAFHPIVQQWFSSKFDAPTEAQATGWPAIAQGRHTLIAAPTGSGKTLAAFLTCIDALVRQGLALQEMNEGLPDATQVVYVSPLKALSNDIQKNLATPLKEIAILAEKSGTPFPEIRTAVRTGDTKQSERQRMAKKPPHILITTPESLYILLTSKSGRAGLSQVKTLIVDEIHAIADDKRGSHLTLSIERLCSLSQERITRIGLSATQRPIEETARFLVGNENIDDSGVDDRVPDCLIVDTGHRRQMDLDLHIPEMELGPIASHELWAETLDTVADMVRKHETTLVFCNTRRMVERVSHQLSQRLGEDAVVPHHGSLSRSSRLAAEEKLKNGQVQACVATASLELGIDIGDVDLVCQLGSPRSLSLVLQRVGRSGHAVKGIPKGRLFPLTRDELVECTALLTGIRRGQLDTLRIPPWPLDILAQQIVATCVSEDWEEDDLFSLMGRAYPYRDLPRRKFDQVIEALSTGFAPRLGGKGAFLHRDGVNHKVKARRGAGIAAMTSGGAIPDNADYDVIADPEETFVGTVNEDFAIESLAGDIFLLGNTPWKIRRIESGKVRVEDAQGQSPSIPFWLGEAPGRTMELSQEVTALREGVDQRLEQPKEAQAWLMSQSGVGEEAGKQIVAYLKEGKRVLGMVPTGRRLVAERFFDESGGMQLVIHAPFGASVNRAWGMALRKQICRSFDFEFQASATDDGLNFSLGPNLSFPLDEVFSYIKSHTAEKVLTQSVLQAPLFVTRWRWNATRSLAILRHTGGKKVPAPLLRMRSDDLLAAVFPAQVACQDNAMPGDIEVPDNPLAFETMRDCLTEAMDLEGLKEVLTAMEQGGIEIYAKDTVQPSVFAHQILNAMPYAFLDDAPLEERRARAVSLRRALPDDARDLSALDADAVNEESQNAWPRVRDKDELHDALLLLGILPKAQASSKAQASNNEQILFSHKPAADQVQNWFNELSGEGRAYNLELPGSGALWVAAERLALVKAAVPKAVFTPTPPDSWIASLKPDEELAQEDAILAIVRGWVECSGPVTASGLAGALELEGSDVTYALAQLENEGLVLRGSFTPALGEQQEDEFCDRRILARIHRATIGRLRKEVEPVTPAQFMRFLFEWQHVSLGHQLQGEGGLLDVIELLQGFEAASGSLETELLSTRMVDYKPLLLDLLCLGGEAVWGRFSLKRESTLPGPDIASNGQPANSISGRAPLTRTTPISIALRESLEWLLDRPKAANSADVAGLSGAALEVVEFLDRRGASFLSEIISATRRLPSDVEEALWQLAAAGRVTADGLDPLRQRINGKPNRRRKDLTNRRTTRSRRTGFSRWSLLAVPEDEEDEHQTAVVDRVELKARQLLKRYGVLFPELLAREPMAPRWRDLVRVLRRLEARGEIRGGRFVSGFIGEQFALPETIETLRASRGREPNGRFVTVSACDPLNLVGILSPGERVPAILGNRIVFRDGVAMCSLEGGNVIDRLTTDIDLLASSREQLFITLGKDAPSLAPEPTLSTC